MSSIKHGTTSNGSVLVIDWPENSKLCSRAWGIAQAADLDRLIYSQLIVLSHNTLAIKYSTTINNYYYD